jgi:hypothetical protein
MIENIVETGVIMKKIEIKVGSKVAFNKLDDAVWFEVLRIDDSRLTIREEDTNYSKQYIHKCYVAQVKK